MHVVRAISWRVFVSVPLMLGALGISYADHHQGDRATVDVCALVPREEVSKILGRNIGRARLEKRVDGATECRYSGGLGTITIMVGTGVPKAKWDAFMQELKTSGASLDAVGGVGDGAYFWDDNRLYAHTGNYEVTISTDPAPGAEPAKTRADAVAVAKAVVAKLKG